MAINDESTVLKYLDKTICIHGFSNVNYLINYLYSIKYLVHENGIENGNLARVI